MLFTNDLLNIEERLPYDNYYEGLLKVYDTSMDTLIQLITAFETRELINEV